MHITLNALSCHDNGNGTVSLDLASHELTSNELALIADLFPHLADQAHLLLEKEALLSALATEADMSRPAITNDGYGTPIVQKTSKPKADKMF